MMIDLPKSMPRDSKGAYAHLGTVTKPDIHDLELIVLLEAAGQGSYQGMANAAPNAAIRDLLILNGQEEIDHAHRVIRAIKILFDKDVSIPPHDLNPFYVVPTIPVLTPDMLEKAVGGELAGEKMYNDWADQIDNAQAADLLRQNAREEHRHADRDAEALSLLRSA
jgi:hypothetical protein